MTHSTRGARLDVISELEGARLPRRHDDHAPVVTETHSR
jgi:hypothetical protein